MQPEPVNPVEPVKEAAPAPPAPGTPSGKDAKKPSTKIDTSNLARDENSAEQGKATPKEEEEDSWFGLGKKKPASKPVAGRRGATGRS